MAGDHAGVPARRPVAGSRRRRGGVGRVIRLDGRIVVYVVNSRPGTVTPIDAATDTAGKPVRAGLDSGAIVITPAGRTALVGEGGGVSGSVIAIRTTGNVARKPVRVGDRISSLAIRPDGKDVYAGAGDAMKVIRTAGDTARATIKLGRYATAIAFTPDGTKAYVLNPDDTRSSLARQTTPACVFVDRYFKC